MGLMTDYEPKEGWKPEYEKEPALEAPAFSYEDLIGSGLLKLVASGAVSLGSLIAMMKISGGSKAPVNTLTRKQAGMFIGPKAKSWDNEANKLAMKLDKEGTTAREIWAKTGNWKAPDGNWRQEIPDDAFDVVSPKGSALEYMHDKGGATHPARLSDVVNHPTLLKAYPDMRSQNAHLNARVFGGEYSPSQHGMAEAFDLPFRHTDGMFANKSAAKTSTLHELQHGVQNREGWQFGGDPSKLGEDKYRRILGEVEARATQVRQTLTAEQRRSQFPEDSFDIKRARIIK